MNWQPIDTAPHEVRVLVYLPDQDQVVEAWYSPNTGLWPRDQEFDEYGEACNVGLPTHWMPLPNPPKQYSASIDDELEEEIDACLSFIRHNKVYEKLEEADIEAYNMAETLIETLRDKLEEEMRISTLRGNMIEFELIPNLHDAERKLKDTEKSRDQWRSMWEKEQTDNEELQRENLELKAKLDYLSKTAYIQLEALELYMKNLGSEKSTIYEQESLLADQMLRKAIESAKG